MSTFNPFKDILRDDNLKQILIESSSWILIRDKFPQSRFHFLLVHKGGKVDLFELTDPERVECLRLCELVLKLYRRKNPSGYVLKVNFGVPQEIKHLHVHLMIC